MAAAAALVIEIVSPKDKSRDKFGFYAARDVNEVLIVDPAKRCSRTGSGSENGSYEEIEHSAVIGLGPSELDQSDRLATQLGRTSASFIQSALPGGAARAAR